MGKMQREKGKRFERWVADKLRAIFGNTVKRGWQAAKLDPGVKPPDVDGTPYHVECKAGAQPSPRAALAQAVADSGGKLIPVAVIKDDRRKPFIIMDFDDWAAMVRDVEAHKTLRGEET